MSETYLSRQTEPRVKEHPGKSGFMALPNGYDAFAARLMLADLAEKTLDVQYYIWEKDISGTLLLEALIRAADRGVRVRLLLDDNNTSGLDADIAKLDSHPRIEVRLFNPFRYRKWRVIDYLTDLPRVNRRMHNKSFTADNAATIIGGRNIGDEYFDVGPDLFFIDLDALAVGPVVNEVSQDFNRYWTSESSWPAGRVLKTKPVSAGFSPDDSILENDAAARKYLRALTESPLAGKFPNPDVPFEWTRIRMVSDDPAKGAGRAPEHTLLPQQLRKLLDHPSKEMFLVAPYLVPGKRGFELFASLRERNIKVSILTNSFEATDVAVVHSGYIKRRKELLRIGVRLFELKYAPGQPQEDRLITGSSSSSLHAKTFSIDRTHIFIGSFNFDPRSALLNTEMGFIVESSATAQTLADIFAEQIPRQSYEVRLTEEEELIWIEKDNGKEIIHTKEPGVRLADHAFLGILSRLPIEWLL